MTKDTPLNRSLIDKLEAAKLPLSENPDFNYAADAANRAVDACIEIIRTHKPAPAPGDVLKHLGDVLYMLADLHRDDQCRAYTEAVAFYNAACPDEQVLPTEGYLTRVVHRTPLHDDLDKVARCEISYNEADIQHAIHCALSKTVHEAHSAGESLDVLEAIRPYLRTTEPVRAGAAMDIAEHIPGSAWMPPRPETIARWKEHEVISRRDWVNVLTMLERYMKPVSGTLTLTGEQIIAAHKKWMDSGCPGSIALEGA